MSNLNIESRVYRLTGLTPILGSLPALKELRTIYIGSKAPTAEEAAEEAFDYESAERGLTVFARDKLGQLCIMSHQLKGFFKSALYALRGQYDITAYKSKVDLMLFADPRFIPIQRGNDPIMAEDDILERPLRSSGPKGERISLAASEKINDPWIVLVEISLLPSPKGSKTKGDLFNWEVVEAALDYGSYHGLGQWRNADYGRFLWKRID